MKKLEINTASSPRSTGNSHSSSRKELILRCQKAIFSSYRSDQFADGEGFVVQLGAVLEQYPDPVIIHVSDPRTGIQRRSQWPPTIAEVIAACEEHEDYLSRLERPKPQAERPAYQPPSDELAGSRVFLPWDHPRYEQLLAWTKTAPRNKWKIGQSSDGKAGLWIAWDIWDGPNQLKTALDAGQIP